MPTRPDTSSRAAESAAIEAKRWIDLSNDWMADAHFRLWDDLPGTEHATVRFFDPTNDLTRRMAGWSYPVGELDLSDLARFASGLAQAESDAWANDHPHIATRAYAERRFLLGDRILPWAVPWLDAVERRHGDRTDEAAEAKRMLLDLGDSMRPAPALSGSEGLVVPGYDGYGPLDPDEPSYTFLLSLWSGSLLTKKDLAAARHCHVDRRLVEPTWLNDLDTTAALSNHYDQAALRWESVAVAHAGTAQLWLDLASRARNTARLLSA